MEIVIFKHQNWSEMASEENPALAYKNVTRKERAKAFIMICKVLPYRNVVGNDGYQVTEVPKLGDVIARGLFWTFEDAESFAKTLTK